MPTHVCLAMKKRGFGQGLWNGSGGKPQANETLEETALREVEEEFKVTVKTIEKQGEINFYLRKEDKKVLMHTYIVSEWIGEPVETEEMCPNWFTVDNVPYDKMWKSDSEWLPVILSGKKIKAIYTYECEGGAVEAKKIEKVDNF